MANKYIIQEETMAAIGDAIREKTNKTEMLSPLEMPDEIRSISGGGEKNNNVSWTFSESTIKQNTSGPQDIRKEVTSAELVTTLVGLETTGGCWFDTGVSPKNTIRVQFRGKMDKATGSTFIGCNGSGSREYRFFGYSNQFYLDMGYEYHRGIGGNINYKDEYTLEIGDSYVKDLDTDSYIINFSKQGTFNYEDLNIRILNNPEQGYLRWIKIYDEDELLRDYEIRDDDGYYFYDKVEGKKYYSEGENQFSPKYALAPKEGD